MDFLGELNAEGRTIVMVTHDLRLAGRAKHALRLVNGSIQPDGQAQPLPVAIASTEQRAVLSTN
jgi:ABC-type lipoprotein export system ATPase subunit